MSMRYVRPLTEQQRALLESTMKNDASHRARMRAHGLLLSSEGMTIKAIAKIYHMDRDTVSTWIKKWEKPHSIEFSGGVGHCSSKASRREDLEIEQPVACWDCSSFHFDPTLASMLGATLIRYQVIEVR